MVSWEGVIVSIIGDTLLARTPLPRLLVRHAHRDYLIYVPIARMTLMMEQSST